MEIKSGHNGDDKPIETKDELYPSPQTIRKAELAEITFKDLLRLRNDIERLEKRVEKLEKEI